MNGTRWLAAAALAAALAFVFVDQPRDDGFHRGHRGWVSSHTLAIVERSIPENGFVGYTLALRTERGRDLYYFDRYPVFFAAGLEVLQDLFAKDTLEEIHVSRQAMNAVYALTLVMAVLFLVELGLPLELAVAASALAGASSTIVAFRDMVHFDQPALLGIVALLWSIARYRRGGSGALVIAVSAAAVLSGRGYASFAVLGAWWIFESAALLRQAGAGAFRSIVRGVPTAACLVSIAVGTLCLGYNVVMESRITGAPLMEAGILRSASQRLALDEGFNARNEKRLAWSHLLQSQQASLAHGVLPYTRRDPIQSRPWLRGLLAVLTLVVAVGFAATRPAATRSVWLTAVTAGPVWMLAMRNLVAFHQYTAIYLFPLCLAFFAAFLFRLPRRAHLVAALAACALLAYSTETSNRAILEQAGTGRQDTRDMMAIEQALEPGDAVATDKAIFRGVPYALGFYLPDHDVIVEGRAPLVISRKRRFDRENLTPDNASIFLFRPQKRWMAHSSLARHHRDSAAARKVSIRHETPKPRGSR